LLLGLVAHTVAAQGPPGGALPPPPVTLGTVEIKTIDVAYEYVGITQASKTVEVRARVQGFLETRDFLDGAYVKESARLFTIDPRSFKADREIAAAQVEEAESRLHLAEQEVKRMQSVKQPGAITQSDLDQKIAEQSSAVAALRLAKAQLSKADLELSYATVTAPLTGFAGKAQKEIGSLVDSAQNSLLTTMQQVDPLYVSFQVSESDYLTWKHEVKGGQLVLAQGDQAPHVEITLLDGSPFENEGVLDFENVNLNTQTGTVELRATFKNEGNVLKPGQFVKVHLKGWQRPNTMTVPQRAVSQSPQGAYVYVVGPDNKAERRSIKAGDWAGKDWAVLDGLKEGERVIVEGLTKVRPGSTVAPVEPGSHPEASSTPSEPPAAR
jgi:membrane fusion protein (multidrug efflux system)